MSSSFALSSSAASEMTQIATLAKPQCQQNRKPPLKWLDECELKEDVETEASTLQQQLLHIRKAQGFQNKRGQNLAKTLK